MTIQARPTTYNGVKMRSRLEARWAELLDLACVPWQYEPRAYASQRGQYLPDFVVTNGRVPWFIEVKGHVEIADLGGVLRRMEIIQASEPDALLWLVIGDSDCPAIFVKAGSGPWTVRT